MNVNGEDMSNLHRIKKYICEILSSVERKADDIDVDELKQKAVDVASNVNQKVKKYDAKSKLDDALEHTKKQIDKLEIGKIKGKVVDAASNTQADITCKYLKWKAVVHKKKERFFLAIKKLSQKVWRITKWVVIIILVGSVVGMFLPRGNPVAKSSCYARGIAYYTAIGSFPTLSNGEDALSKIGGMCARSGGIAFGSDD